MADISLEYKIWKKNTPFLYDQVITHPLEFPSLTVNWLPDVKYDRNNESVTQRLLVGTHAPSGEPNYLKILNVTTPSNQVDIDITQYDAGSVEFGGFNNDISARVVEKMTIPHPGEINIARHCPYNSALIATRSPEGCFVYNYTRHPSRPVKGAEPSPDIRLNDCKGDYFALCWSPASNALLASGSDGRAVVWDLDAELPKAFDPIWTKKVGSEINDVQFHYQSKNILAVAGEDLAIFDTRGDDTLKPKNPHQGSVNCIGFNHFNPNIFLSGGQDSIVKLWDMRNLSEPLYNFCGHDDEVFGVAFSPFNEAVFASSSADRRIAIWDPARIGELQSEVDRQDGAAELLFLHAGHQARLCDFSWNPNKGQEFVIASVAEDNLLQIWQMAGNIYANLSLDQITLKQVE
eukprot:TRINITY_DN2539_c0_g1_i2.p1 TRINITY_DN2539_c0_g1~~TRINITY_DN2539_c0_g1_i2.p1  ORF type:complete len:405 (+),score=107.16 TRINITY_DN2539_c0_g1_i2:63-1277(+)